MVTHRPRSIHAVVCEDVRVEMYGKVSLMGIPTPTLWVGPSLPTTLDYWQIAVWTDEPADDRFQKFTLRLISSVSDEPDHLVDMSDAFVYADNHADTDRLRFFATVRLPVLTIDREGRVEFIVETEREAIPVVTIPIRALLPVLST